MSEKPRTYLYGGYGGNIQVTRGLEAPLLALLGVNVGLTPESNIRFEYKMEESDGSLSSLGVRLCQPNTPFFGQISALAIQKSGKFGIQTEGEISAGAKQLSSDKSFFSETRAFLRTDGAFGFGTTCGMEI